MLSLCVYKTCEYYSYQVKIKTQEKVIFSVILQYFEFYRIENGSLKTRTEKNLLHPFDDIQKYFE